MSELKNFSLIYFQNGTNMFTTLWHKLEVVRLEKFIDDPLYLIAIGIINFDIFGHMWKNQLKFQLKTLNKWL